MAGSSDRTGEVDEARLRQVAAAEGCDEYHLFLKAAKRCSPPAPIGEVQRDFQAFRRDGPLPGYVRWYVAHYLEQHPEAMERHLAGLRLQAVWPWLATAAALGVIAAVLWSRVPH